MQVCDRIDHQFSVYEAILKLGLLQASAQRAFTVAVDNQR